MKTSITFIIILLNFTLLFAEGLEPKARYIKDNFTKYYENTIRKHALEKWSDDFTMVVYEINQQCDALAKLVNKFNSNNTSIVYKAIKKWSIKGYEAANVTEFKKMKVFGLKQLLKLHCDWSMVEYEYDNQVEAKNSF